MDSGRISITTNCNPKAKALVSRSQILKAGFTLVEIMIVVVILGFFVAYGARKLGDRSDTVKTQVRRFSAMVKKLRTRARLENRTYRLVFDLPGEKDRQQSYWIEATDKKALLLSSEQRDDLLDGVEETEGQDGQKIKPDPQGFAPDTSVIKEAPATLPKGLFFESVELAGDPVEQIKEGRIYIYFFPQGYVQGSAIHFTDRDKVHWTVIIEGLTGRTSIFSEERKLADFNLEEE